MLADKQQRLELSGGYSSLKVLERVCEVHITLELLTTDNGLLKPTHERRVSNEARDCRLSNPATAPPPPRAPL